MPQPSLAKRRPPAKSGKAGNRPAARSGGIVEFVKTIVYAVLIAFGLRTIAFEPFNIPSGSMIPTLLIGDYLFVSKYAYGYSHFSLPFSPDLFSGRIFGGVPKRGDVAVFRLPRDTSTDYIKRIVGLPGDRLQVRGGQLFINGVQVPREADGDYTVEGDGPSQVDRQYIETLPDPLKRHLIIKQSERGGKNDTEECPVPDGYVFAMGAVGAGPTRGWSSWATAWAA